MLSTDKHSRFPRSAVARRLVSIQDTVQRSRDAIGEEYRRSRDKRRKGLLDERLLFLEQLHYDLDAMLRALQYWR